VTDQEKQQLFQMLAQGLMQYMAPALQQFVGQSVAQGVKAGIGGASASSMTQECVVTRTADEDSPEDLVQVKTTPAQLLAEIADKQWEIVDHLEVVEEKLEQLNGKLGRRKKAST
jgi:hypothetical protein